MGLTFEQKMSNIPPMIIVTVPGISCYIDCIIEDTPENRKLLMENINFKRGNRVLHFFNDDYFEEKVKKGYKLIDDIKEERL